MIYDLKLDDNVFNEKSLIGDEITFNVLLRSILPKNPKIAMTNGRSIVLGQTNDDWNMWIWTSDDITTVEYNEFMAFLPILFENKKSIGITAKQNVVDDIAALLKAEIKSTGGHIVYRCDNVISREPIGLIRNALIDEKYRVAELLSGFQNDCFYADSIAEDFIERAEKLITDQYFYVLEVDGIITAMTYRDSTYKHYVCINNVYTDPEYRNRGHAAYLVSELCKKILSENMLPVLYADEFYPASNKVYRNIGFTECGRLKLMTMVI